MQSCRYHVAREWLTHAVGKGSAEYIWREAPNCGCVSGTTTIIVYYSISLRLSHFGTSALGIYETNATMSFETYIQRADDYITKQIHKFEQQKRGRRSPPRSNGYHPMPTIQRTHQGRPPSQGGYPGSPASQGGPSPAPQGWTQEYDPRSQRWYYIERATGRSQWQPPSFAPPRAATFQPDVRMPSPYQQFNREDEHSQRWRERSSSQPQRPGSGVSGHGQFLDPRQSGGSGGGSTSPGGLHSQLPPGSHLDMKTGKVVSSMFPEGQSHHSWQQEIQRI
jgi:hypothetical protein